MNLIVLNPVNCNRTMVTAVVPHADVPHATRRSGSHSVVPNHGFAVKLGPSVVRSGQECQTVEDADIVTANVDFVAVVDSMTTLFLSPVQYECPHRHDENAAMYAIHVKNLLPSAVLLKCDHVSPVVEKCAVPKIPEEPV